MTPEKAEIHGTRLPVLQGVLPIAMARVSADGPQTAAISAVERAS
jgi:hypothetical protein